MTAWLKLIRWKNLVIVFLTQLLVWYCLIYGSLDLFYTHFFKPESWADRATLLLDLPNFLLLSISTVFITAAGYIINDYFDIRIDIINRPDKVILDKRIPLKYAIIAHVVLNVAALLMCGLVAMRGRHIFWPLVQLFCTIVLWFYSTHFKRQFITGNIIVALLTALTIAIIALYEPHLVSYIHHPVVIKSSNGLSLINPFWVALGYAFFAFMLTWMREIVKDMEDYIGDAEEGCVTMPIKMGLQFSARFSQSLAAITIFVLGIITYYFLSVSYVSLAVYTAIVIIAPLTYWIFFLGKQHNAAHYAAASKALKWIMITGILSLVVYYLTIISIQ